MVALAGGLAAVILGIIGLIIWWGHFIDIVMGALPIMFILGGALAAYLGFEELKDKRSAESFEESDSDLKREVESLKEEVQELKKDQNQSEKENPDN
jgi:hypothetical protein